MAAGAMLVLGTVVAGALGLNHGGPSPSPVASGAEPVGALPGHGPTPAPAQPAPAAPEAAAPVQQPFVNAAAAQNAKQEPTGPAGEIGVPARVRPPAPVPNPPQRTQPAPAPAPQQPAAGPVQTLTEPVTDTVGGNTLSGAVAPVTSTVDSTLQPALSLIGGLLGHK
jgi:hypothetical protein